MIRFAIAACVALSAMPSLAGTIAGPIVNPANGNSYFLLEAAPWTESQAEARRLGGNLVTINDEAENDWVFDTFGSIGGVDRDLWIGLTDEASEGDFIWISGETSTYRNWGEGQPSDGGVTGFEDFAYITVIPFTPIGPFPAQVPRFWNDVNDGRVGPGPAFGVVEIVIPEPTSSALVAIGGLLTGLARRRG